MVKLYYNLYNFTTNTSQFLANFIHVYFYGMSYYYIIIEIRNLKNEVIEMSEKIIVHKVPEEIRGHSIETLKIRKSTLDYLRKNGFKTIEDIIDRQDEIPNEFRGNIYAYIIFGIED